MKTKLVVFDFDGTIADSFEQMLMYGQKYAKLEGIEADLSNREFVEELRNFHSRDLLKRFGISLYKLPAVIKDIRKEMYKDISKINMFEGMDRVFTELKEMDLPLGVLTSNSKEVVEKFIEDKSLQNTFEFIFSEKNIFGKDKVLKKILKMGNLRNEELIYVGDETRDVEACKKAKVICIAVEWGYNSKYALNEHGADYIVDSPEELLLKLKYISQNS